MQDDVDENLDFRALENGFVSRANSSFKGNKNLEFGGFKSISRKLMFCFLLISFSELESLLN